MKILDTRLARHVGIVIALLALATGPISLLTHWTAEAPARDPALEVRGLIGPELGGGFVPPTRLGANGDITSVVAGNGLTGGATSGTATIDVAVGAGLAVGADLLTLNLAGAGCSIGEAVNSISSDGTGFCGPTTTNNYLGTRLEWVEEYLNRSTIASGAALGIFSGAPSGTGAATNDALAGTTTRPGLFEMSTGTTSTGSASLQTNFQVVDFGSGNWNFQWTGGFPTLSTSSEEYAFIVGFADTTTINVTDGCYLLYDRGNVATGGPNSGNADTWSCWCANNSTRTKFLMDGSTVSDESFTTIDSPVAALTLPSTNIYNAEIRLTGTTRAEFFLNNTKRCNISTNIPSGSSRLTGVVQGIFKSAGSTARFAIVDRTRLAVDLNTARSP